MTIALPSLVEAGVLVVDALVFVSTVDVPVVVASLEASIVDGLVVDSLVVASVGIASVDVWMVDGLNVNILVAVLMVVVEVDTSVVVSLAVVTLDVPLDFIGRANKYNNTNDVYLYKARLNTKLNLPRTPFST